MKKVCEGGAKVSGFFWRMETPNALVKFGVGRLIFRNLELTA